MMRVEDINSLFLSLETFLSGWEVYQKAKQPEGKDVTLRIKQEDRIGALDGAPLR